MSDLETPPSTSETRGDVKTTVAELKSLVQKFVSDRDWERFHAPKNLSMALAIEAAELMEHFQWLGVDESRDWTADPRRRLAVEEELADVLSYVLALSTALDLDLSDAIRRKMRKNEEKYPVDRFRSRFGPEDPREPSSESHS